MTNRYSRYREVVASRPSGGRLMATFTSFMALLAVVLMLTSCEDKSRDYDLLKDGKYTKISLSYKAPELTEYEVNFRSDMGIGGENYVDNLYVFVFDADNEANITEAFAYKFTADQIQDKHDRTPEDGEQDLSRGTVDITAFTAKSKFYLLANDKVLDYKFEGSGIDFQGKDQINVSDENAKSLYRSVTGLKGTLIHQILERPHGNFLMKGEDSFTNLNATGDYKVELHRVDAKVTVTLANGPDVPNKRKNITFEPTKVRVYNMAKEVMPFKTDFYPTENSQVFRNANGSGEDYVECQDFTMDKDGKYTFTIYLSPNYQSLATGPSSYHDRENILSTTGQDHGIRKDEVTEDWEFAPAKATYITIFGKYRDEGIGDNEGRITSGETNYTFHLGFEGNSEGVTTDLTNFSVESNTHYKYNITIKGVENIIFEAQKESFKDKPESGAQGDIFRSKIDHYIDAHYDMFNVVVDKTQVLQSDESGWKQRPLKLVLRTPFTDDQFVRIDLDANDEDFKYKPNGNYPDINWLLFASAPHGFSATSNKWQYRRDIMTPYATALNTTDIDSEYRLRNIKEFFDYISDPANESLIWDDNDQAVFTVYVDEYYYLKEPTQNEKVEANQANMTTGADQDLWKRFVNKPDRVIQVLTDKVYISHDKASRYDEPIFTVKQRSIKTFYDPNKAETGYGIETVEEYTAEDAYKYDDFGTPVEVRRQYNDSFINGRGNTIGMYYDAKNHRERLIGKPWSKAMDIRRNKLLSSHQYARYECLSRNRDTNGNGIIDPHEIRWYLPSIYQLVDINVFRDAFEAEARLYLPGRDKRKKNYVSSSGYKRFDKGIRNSNNPFVLFANGNGMFAALNESWFYNREEEDKKGISIGQPKNNYSAHVRCVRDLGVTDIGDWEFDDSYDKDNTETFRHKYQTEVTMYGKYFTIPGDNYSESESTKLYLKVDKVLPVAMRGTTHFVKKGELPRHDIWDVQNKVPEAIQVYHQNLREKGDTGGEYGANIFKFRRHMKERNLCSRIGPEWRVPSQAEFVIMYRAGLLGDPETHNNKRGIWKTTFWTSTRLGQSPYGKANLAGAVSQPGPEDFIVYNGANIFYPMMSYPSGPGWSYIDAGYRVRCVRDIKPSQLP